MKNFLMIIALMPYLLLASETLATNCQTKEFGTLTNEMPVNDDKDDDDEWNTKAKKTKSKTEKKSADDGQVLNYKNVDAKISMANTGDYQWDTKGTKKTKKQKPFYDVKSQMLGLSGDVESLYELGFKSKIFYNQVEINKSILPPPNKKKKGWDKEQIAIIESKLNEMRVGHQVLMCLFPYQRDENGNIKLSDIEMNERALKNTQYIDVEKANVGALDATTILRDDWNPLLINNYIYLEKAVGDFRDFIVLKVEITEDIINEVYRNWNNPSGFEKINPEVKFVYTGAEKFKKPEKFMRKLSEKVPAFAIRGQLSGRNPATALIGKSSGIKGGDLVSIYSQKEKNGEMESQRISRARVCDVREKDVKMFFVDRFAGSPKNGDMVVLTPDKKQGIGIYGNYSLGNFFAVSATWERIMHCTKSCFTGNLLARVKLNFADYETSIYHYYGLEPPMIINCGIGYGLSWTFLGRFDLMPYVMCECESIIAVGSEESEYGDIKMKTATAWGIRGSVGTRFDINIAHPIKLSIGAEYGHVLGLNMGARSESVPYPSSPYYYPSTPIVRYKDFEELFEHNNYLNNGKKSLSRNGINFFAGIRFVF